MVDNHTTLEIVSLFGKIHELDLFVQLQEELHAARLPRLTTSDKQIWFTHWTLDLYVPQNSTSISCVSYARNICFAYNRRLDTQSY